MLMDESKEILKEMFTNINKGLISEIPEDTLNSSRFMHRFQYAMLVLTFHAGRMADKYRRLLVLETSFVSVDKKGVGNLLLEELTTFLSMLIIFNEYLHCNVDIFKTFEEVDEAAGIVDSSHPTNKDSGELSVPSCVFAVSRAIGVLTATSELGFDKNLGTLYHDVVYEFGLLLSAMSSIYDIKLSEVFAFCLMTDKD